MRNLVHFGLEKLDSLPTKGKLCDRYSPSLNLIRDKKYHWYYAQKYKLADKILNGSVGRNFSDVYKKIKPLVKDWDGNDGWFEDRVGRINRNGYVDTRRWYRYIYVDADNILRKDSKQKPGVMPRVFDGRKHYAYITKRKRERKEIRIGDEKRELALLRLINHPDLFKFYIDLAKTRKTLLSQIHEKPSDPPKIEYYKEKYDRELKKYIKIPLDNPKADWLRRMKSWKWSNDYRVKKAKKAQIELVSILDQMRELEEGNYTIFFESNAYLYSIQKTCHHFEQP